jgi:iron complex outermembrane receptor protein
MNKRVRFHGVRYGVALALYSGIWSGAQAAPQSPARLQKVQVTGTRIKRTDVETAQPILRISREQIERSGYTNIGNLLGQLSSAGAFLNTSVNNGGNG